MIVTNTELLYSNIKVLLFNQITELT